VFANFAVGRLQFFVDLFDVLARGQVFRHAGKGASALRPARAGNGVQRPTPMAAGFGDGREVPNKPTEPFRVQPGGWWHGMLLGRKCAEPKGTLKVIRPEH